MIDNSCKNPSIAKQCDLLSVNKSTYYYKQRGLSEQDLEIMKVIDEIYTGDWTSNCVNSYISP